MCVRIIYYDRFWETFFQDVGYGGTDIDEIQSTTKGINNQGSSSFTSIKTTIQMSTDISVSAKPRKLTPMKKTKPKGNDIFFKMPLCMKNNGNPVSWACNIF